MGSVLFAGDVHLRPGAPEGNRRFLGFLRSRRPSLSRLVLLGDVFDYWIGPRHLDGPDYREVLEELRRTADAGVRVDFLHGNRDYLVEESFEKRTGCVVAGEGLDLELGGLKVHCAHGDFIYNRNPKYAAYRRVMKNRAVRAAVLAIPAGIGKSLARGFKKVSRKTTPAYDWTEDDLLAGARPFFERGVDLLVVGHIHRPQRLQEKVGGRTRTLVVVGDWDGGADTLEFDGREWTFAPTA